MIDTVQIIYATHPYIVTHLTIPGEIYPYPGSISAAAMHTTYLRLKPNSRYIRPAKALQIVTMAITRMFASALYLTLRNVNNISGTHMLFDKMNLGI